jgi:hypothetical protein
MDEQVGEEEQMPQKEEMQRLVDAHKQLDAPMEAAIWIKPNDPNAWLVEVLPNLPSDPEADKPFVFAPSTVFRYALHLISGTKEDIVAAIDRDLILAQAIADGVVLEGRDGVGAELVKAATLAAQRAKAG